MATNYYQAGETLDLVAPSGGVTKGLGYVIGAIFCVAQETKAQTLQFEGKCNGVHSLPKSGSSGPVFSQGEKVFWDNSTKLCKESDTGFFLIGTAVAAAGASDTSVLVKLDGIAVTAV